MNGADRLPSVAGPSSKPARPEQVYRILAAGETRLYLPLSWLQCMRMLPTAVVAKGTANDPAAGYISPPFQDFELPDTIHQIIRNPEMMAEGIVFRFDMRGAGCRPEGIAADSQVYQMSFAHRPAARTPPFTNPEQLLQAPSSDGWAKLADTYYDVDEPIAADADVFAVPLAISVVAAAPNRGRYRHDQDLVVTFQWREQRSLTFDGRWVRKTRHEVAALVTWLATDPARRDRRERLIGERDDD